MEYIMALVDFVLHIDKHLVELIAQYGNWTYAILFLIVFCETGLVVTPILPGDSLLFAAGALAGVGGLNVFVLAALLFVAAVLGDSVNYALGRRFGAAAFEKFPRIFRPAYLEKTQGFYDRYGAKTIVIARFVPIVRTFAPFLAGVGKMNYTTFITYNISGGALWVFSLVFAGYLFGEIPIVKNNFGIVVVVIIILSILPAVFEIARAKFGKNPEAAK